MDWLKLSLRLFHFITVFTWPKLNKPNLNYRLQRWRMPIRISNANLRSPPETRPGNVPRIYCSKVVPFRWSFDRLPVATGWIRQKIPAFPACWLMIALMLRLVNPTPILVRDLSWKWTRLRAATEGIFGAKITVIFTPWMRRMDHWFCPFVVKRSAVGSICGLCWGRGIQPIQRHLSWHYG